MLALLEPSAHSDRVHFTSVDSILIMTILAGFALSVLNLLLAVVNGRSSRMAEVEATASIREQYQRVYKRGRRLVSIARPGKAERRG